jgi:hypothetical protein
MRSYNNLEHTQACINQWNWIYVENLQKCVTIMEFLSNILHWLIHNAMTRWKIWFELSNIIWLWWLPQLNMCMNGMYNGLEYSLDTYA